MSTWCRQFAALAVVTVVSCVLATPGRAALGDVTWVRIDPRASFNDFQTGPDGNFWGVDLGYGGLARTTLAGSSTGFPLAGFSGAGRFAIGPDDRLWLTDGVANSVRRISPSGGDVNEFPLPTDGRDPGGPNPNAIVRGPDDHIWVALTRGSIARVSVTGEVTSFPLPTELALPRSLATGADGSVWFTTVAGDRIGRITPNGTVHSFRLRNPDAGAVSITAGPDGRMWFTEAAGVVGRISPAGAITEYATNGLGLDDIVAGSDGSLWFAETANRMIARLAPRTGEITEFPVYAVSHIVAGPDGNIWLGYGARLGRLSIAGSRPEDVPRPVFAQFVNIARLAGRVRVAERGGLGFRRLRTARRVRIRPIIDARHGRVRVTARNRSGRDASAEISGGVFRVLQPVEDGGDTFIVMVGERPRRCGTDRGRSGRDSSRALGRLHIEAGSQFTVLALSAHTSARDGSWRVTDRCDGTLVEVDRGVVAGTEFRLNGSDRRFTVRRGGRHLAQRPA